MQLSSFFVLEDGFAWFYQQAKWYDADKDGVLDLFTCRTRITSDPGFSLNRLAISIMCTH